MSRPGAATLCAVVLTIAATATACSSTDPGPPTATVVETVTAGAQPTQHTSSPTTSPTCTAPMIALDPGHNGEAVAEFDAKTGIAMRDYPNGAEDADAFAVARGVEKALKKAGYRVVLLKPSPTASRTYRERVDLAERSGAAVGISIHTYTDDHRVFPQRVGLYREGPTKDGTVKRVTFSNVDTAKKSQQLSRAFAAARSTIEGRPVQVTDNSFDGRAPLWSGNIPVISLLSEKVPWVYNEFGINGGGGSNPIGDAGVSLYAKALTAATEAAIPNTCRR